VNKVFTVEVKAEAGSQTGGERGRRFHEKPSQEEVHGLFAHLNLVAQQRTQTGINEGGGVLQADGGAFPELTTG
jgi:hypothetical protein